MRAVVGHTGFVGSTLMRQSGIRHGFNSSNVDELSMDNWSLLLVAAAPAVKWYANQHPDEDRQNLERLADRIARTRAERLVLISTVDVYPEPVDVDEQTVIDAADHHAYGRNRLWLEKQVRSAHPGALVVRLPALFGEGLKKNFVRDMLDGQHLDWTDHRSEFQFYDMARLWDDIQQLLAADVKLVNLATEPVTAASVAEHAFGRSFSNVKPEGPVVYDMRSRHASLLGGSGPYHMGREQVLGALAAFVAKQRD